MMDRITVVVDTREQEPYSFDSDKVSAVRKALREGGESKIDKLNHQYLLDNPDIASRILSQKGGE